MSEGNGVTYTVKELLAKIEGKLDGVIITIGQKADRHDVEALGSRVAALEASDQGSRERREFVRWLVPVAAVVLVALIVHFLP